MERRKRLLFCALGCRPPACSSPHRILLRRPVRALVRRLHEPRTRPALPDGDGFLRVLVRRRGKGYHHRPQRSRFTASRHSCSRVRAWGACREVERRRHRRDQRRGARCRERGGRGGPPLGVCARRVPRRYGTTGECNEATRRVCTGLREGERTHTRTPRCLATAPLPTRALKPAASPAHPRSEHRVIRRVRRKLRTVLCLLLRGRSPQAVRGGDGAVLYASTAAGVRSGLATPPQSCTHIPLTPPPVLIATLHRPTACRLATLPHTLLQARRHNARDCHDLTNVALVFRSADLFGCWRRHQRTRRQPLVGRLCPAAASQLGVLALLQGCALLLFVSGCTPNTLAAHSRLISPVHRHSC